MLADPLNSASIIVRFIFSYACVIANRSGIEVSLCHLD